MKVINLFHSKPKTITIVFFIGVAITKLSVWDRVILTEEEEKIIKHLRKDLDDAEKFVRKEIEDIEKAVK